MRQNRPKKSRITAALIMACLILLGSFSVKSSAEDNSSSSTGPEMITGMRGISKGDHINFGTIENSGYSGSELKWRVLNPDKDNAGTGGAVFVMSESLVGEKDKKGNPEGIKYYDKWYNPFRKITQNNFWHNSDMPPWCNNFYKKVFSSQEQKAIRSVTKKENGGEEVGPFRDRILGVDPTGHNTYSDVEYEYITWPDTIREQRVFFPSYEELKGEENLAANMNGRSGWSSYWLRTPGDIYPYYDLFNIGRAFVMTYTNESQHKDYGKTHVPAFEYEDITQKWWARPAMNIEKASVLFSNVPGAKDKDFGDLKNIDQSSTGIGDWDLTIEDPDRRSFNAEGVKISSGGELNTLEVRLSGARTGAGEYISAIVVDRNGNLTKYGRLASCASSVPLTLNIPISWDKEDKFYLFNEKYTGKGHSSYSSPLQFIDINSPDIAIHTVVFDLNGHGSPQPASQNVESKDKAAKPSGPYAPGYEFTGWYTDADCRNKWDFDNVVTADMTLYAGWAAHKYTVRFDSNGGTGTMQDMSRSFKDEIALPDCGFKAPDKRMKFTGWNDKKDGSGNNYYPDDTADLTFDDDALITLYAQWSGELMVAYHLNGHGSPQPDAETTDATRNWKIKEPDKPSEKGYTFGGWFRTPACNEDDKWDFYRDALENNSMLFAGWKANSYTIHFDPNGGSGSMRNQEREYGDGLALPNPLFERYGCSLDEWNTMPDGSGESYSTDFTGDITEEDGVEVTLYAIWTRSQYIIEYDSNGGNGSMESQRRTYGDGKELSANRFKRYGFIFTGWNTKADGTGDYYADRSKEDVVTDDSPVKLYAQWIDEYTVHFDPNGGSGNMADQVRRPGDNKSLPANSFVYDGSRFAGWNTKRDGSGKDYTNEYKGDIGTVESEITLYAQWTITYTVQFDANGGSGSMSGQERIYGDGKSITANAYTKEGSVFAGWNTSSDGSGAAYPDKAEGDLIAEHGTIKLYAQWKPAELFTITFDANGGSFSDGNTRKRSTDGHGILAQLESGPENKPAGKNGFYGWYTSPDGGMVVRDGAKFASDTTLYANWTMPRDDLDWDMMKYDGPFTVHYNPNATDAIVDPVSRRTEKGWDNQNSIFISEHPVPVRNNHGFDGWYTEEDGGTLVIPGNRDSASPQPSHFISDTTLYARWRTPEYTVRYNGNGGNGKMPDQARTLGDGGSLALNSFTRQHYRFTGWNTRSDGKGDAYTDGYPGDLTDTEDTIVLYAQWETIKYTVSFDLNGNGGPQPKPQETGSEKDFRIDEPKPEPTDEDYVFGGWYKEKECVNKWDFNKDIVSDPFITLYAKWTGKPYTVSFDPGKGSYSDDYGPMDDQERMAGDGIALPPCKYAPPKFSNGAVFTGWNTKADGSGESFADRYTGDVAKGGTVTLYAQWSESRIAVFKLNGHGDSAPAPQMSGELYDYRIKEPDENPEEKGYVFTGWFKDAECTDKWDFGSDRLEERTTTLYAGWTAIEYSITFNANPPEGSKATGSVDNQQRKYDDGKSLPKNAFEIDGLNGAEEAYTFTGWNTESDGSGDAFGDEDAQNISDSDGAEIILYAQWDMEQITTSFLPDGRQGEPYEAELTQMGLRGGLQITWSLVQNSGQLPDGLSLSKDGIISGITDQAGTHSFRVEVSGTDAMGDIITLSKDLSIYLRQNDPEPFIIEFTAGMNSIHDKKENNDLTFTTNGPAEMFSGLDVDGKTLDPDDYRFDGNEKTDIILKSEYLKSLDEGSHIITAIYNDGQKPFTQFTVIDSSSRMVVFNLNGHGSPIPEPQEIKSDNGWLVREPAIPAEQGYEFTGWYREKECKTLWDFASDRLTEPETVLYAGWTANKYTVNFSANSPSDSYAHGNMRAQDREYDDGKSLPKCRFTILSSEPKGKKYVFTGWNTEPDGTGDAFGDEDARNITHRDGASVTLYAQWNNAQIVTVSLPDGRQGDSYKAELKQTGLLEDADIEWKISRGELPEGLSLNKNGTISGVPDQAGTFVFTVSVTGTNIMGAKETLRRELSILVAQNDPDELMIYFTEGMNGEWTKGNEASLKFKTNGPFEMFEGVSIDDRVIKNGTDYIAKAGSTIIELNPGYLDTLDIGNHIITAIYNDGQEPLTQFMIKAKPDEEKDDDKTDPVPEPDDGDDKEDNIKPAPDDGDKEEVKPTPDDDKVNPTPKPDDEEDDKNPTPDKDDDDDGDNHPDPAPDNHNDNDGDNHPDPAPDNHNDNDGDNSNGKELHGAKTGDSANVIGWIVLMVLSSVISVFMAAGIRRRKSVE